MANCECHNQMVYRLMGSQCLVCSLMVSPQHLITPSRSSSSPRHPHLLSDVWEFMRRRLLIGFRIILSLIDSQIFLEARNFLSPHTSCLPTTMTITIAPMFFDVARRYRNANQSWESPKINPHPFPHVNIWGWSNWSNPMNRESHSNKMNPQQPSVTPGQQQNDAVPWILCHCEYRFRRSHLFQSR